MAVKENEVVLYVLIQKKIFKSYLMVNQVVEQYVWYDPIYFFKDIYACTYIL